MESSEYNNHGNIVHIYLSTNHVELLKQDDAAVHSLPVMLSNIF